MLNNINIMGRLVADPEVRLAGDSKVARFRIACDRDFIKKDNTRPVDFINVEAWNATGEFVDKYFGKGDLIALHGRLESSEYEKDGQKRQSYHIRASNVYFTGSKKDAADTNDNGSSEPKDDFDDIKFPGE